MQSRPCQKSGKHAGKPYRKSQKAYAVDFSVSLPTVKRWWARGLPCDDADAMGEFLSPRGRKPAESDADFEAPSVVTPPEPEEEAPKATAEPFIETPVRLDETFFEGKGFLAEIERLRKAARERSAAYFAAIANHQGSEKIRNRLAEWVSVLEALRKLEKDAPGIRKANDLAIDRAEMEAAIGQTFQAYRAQANVSFLQLIEKLGLGDDPDAQEAAAVALERLLRTLADLSAGAADEAEAAAPANPDA